MWVVTGAKGFIGSVLVSTLRSEGREVMSCDFKYDTSDNVMYDWIHPDSLLDILEYPCTISGVVHLGAISDTMESDVTLLIENNMLYTLKLLDLCAKRSIPFIYASSAAAYGSSMVIGDFAVSSHNHNFYGLIKKQTDDLISQKNRDSRWYGLRFFNVYGPNEDRKGRMKSLVAKAFEQSKLGTVEIFDADVRRDFVYVKDVVSWITQIMDQKEDNPLPSGIYDLGTGQEESPEKIVKLVEDNLGETLSLARIPMPEKIRSTYQHFTRAYLNPWFKRPEWPLSKGVEDYVKTYLVPGKRI